MTNLNESDTKDERPLYEDGCGSPRVMSATEMNEFISRIDAEAERIQHEIAIALEDYNKGENDSDSESDISNLDLYGMATEMLESLGDKENRTKRPPSLSLGHFLAASRSPLASTPCMINTSFPRSPLDLRENVVTEFKLIQTSNSKFSFDNESLSPERETSSIEDNEKLAQPLNVFSCENKQEIPENLGDEQINKAHTDILKESNKYVNDSINERNITVEMNTNSASIGESPKVASPLKENDPFEWAYEVWREHGLMGRKNNQTKRHANVIIDQSTPKTVHQGLDWLEWDLSPIDEMILSKRKSSLSKGADRAKEFARFSSGNFHDVLSSWKKGYSEDTPNKIRAREFARLRKPEQFQDLLRKWREARQQREASGQQRAMKYAQEAKANLQNILKMWHESQGAEFESWAHEHAKSVEECQELLRSWRNSHSTKEIQTDSTQLNSVEILIQQWRQSHLSEFEEWARQQAHSSDEFQEILRHWQELSAYDNSFFSPPAGTQELNEIQKGSHTFSPHSKSREAKSHKSVAFASSGREEEIDDEVKHSTYSSLMIDKRGGVHDLISNEMERTEITFENQNRITKRFRRCIEPCDEKQKWTYHSHNTDLKIQNEGQIDESFLNAHIVDLQIPKNVQSKDPNFYQDVVMECQDGYWSNSLNALDLATKLKINRKLHRCCVSSVATEEKTIINKDGAHTKLIKMRVCGWFSIAHLEYLDLALTGRLKVRRSCCTQSTSQFYQAFRQEIVSVTLNSPKECTGAINLVNTTKCCNVIRSPNIQSENVKQELSNGFSNLVSMWQESQPERLTGERRAKELARDASGGFDRLISLWRESNIFERKHEDKTFHSSRDNSKGYAQVYGSDANFPKSPSPRSNVIQNPNFDEKSSSLLKMKKEFITHYVAEIKDDVPLLFENKESLDLKKNYPYHVASIGKDVEYQAGHWSYLLYALDLAIPVKNQKSLKRTFVLRVPIEDRTLEDSDRDRNKLRKTKVCGWFTLNHLDYLDLALSGQVGIRQSLYTPAEIASFQESYDGITSDDDNDLALTEDETSLHNRSSQVEKSPETQKPKKQLPYEFSHLVSMWREARSERLTGEHRAKELARDASGCFNELILKWKALNFEKKDYDVTCDGDVNKWVPANSGDSMFGKSSLYHSNTVKHNNCEERNSCFSEMANNVRSHSLDDESPNLHGQYSPCKNNSETFQIQTGPWSNFLNALDLAIRIKEQKASNRICLLRVAIKKNKCKNSNECGSGELQTSVCGWFSIKHLEYLDLAFTGQVAIRHSRCTPAEISCFQGFDGEAGCYQDDNLSIDKMTDDKYIVKRYGTLSQNQIDQSKSFCDSSVYGGHSHQAETERRDEESLYEQSDLVSLKQELMCGGDSCDFDHEVNTTKITHPNHFSAAETKGIFFSREKIDNRGSTSNHMTYLSSPFLNNSLDYGENLSSNPIAVLDLAINVRTPEVSNRLCFVGISIDEKLFEKPGKSGDEALEAGRLGFFSIRHLEYLDLAISGTYPDGMNVLQYKEDGHSCVNSFKKQGLSTLKNKDLGIQAMSIFKNVDHLGLIVRSEAFEESDCVGETEMKNPSIAEDMSSAAQSDLALRHASGHPCLGMANQDSPSKCNIIQPEKPSVKLFWNSNENSRDKSKHSFLQSNDHSDLRTSEIKSMVVELNTERLTEESDHKLSLSKSHKFRHRNSGQKVRLADKFSELLSTFHESRARNNLHTQRHSVGWEQNVVTDILFYSDEELSTDDDSTCSNATGNSESIATSYFGGLIMRTHPIGQLEFDSLNRSSSIGIADGVRYSDKEELGQRRNNDFKGGFSNENDSENGRECFIRAGETFFEEPVESSAMTYCNLDTSEYDLNKEGDLALRKKIIPITESSVYVEDNNASHQHLDFSFARHPRLTSNAPGERKQNDIKKKLTSIEDFISALSGSQKRAKANREKHTSERNTNSPIISSGIPDGEDPLVAPNGHLRSCECAESSFSGNDKLVDFFLPLLGMACTCGKDVEAFPNPEVMDPTAIEYILRPWQCEFLKSFGIHRGDQLVKAYHRSAGTLAKALKKWRKKHELPRARTVSCGLALCIWSKVCKVYVRWIRRQLALGVDIVKPPSGVTVLSHVLTKKDYRVSVPHSGRNFESDGKTTGLEIEI